MLKGAGFLSLLTFLLPSTPHPCFFFWIQELSASCLCSLASESEFLPNLCASLLRLRDQGLSSQPATVTGFDLGPARCSPVLNFLGSSRSRFVVQWLSRVRLFATPGTAARQASLSLTFTISQSLLKLMSTKSVMPSDHLVLCCPLLLPSMFPSIRVFSNESVLCIRWPKYWSFSFSISPSMNMRS